ncbi:serine hydrolase FSH [Podospora aff. communis PSN243]|uniref:Serine hydrolase FSH n=1 Tax=Podospora aff. communis PSN243 TaxID=3040156 RepID=A0AAV9GWA9_9PEZI|nr:serine hydrolase FSH [Podospora aff. communis PSN243]
MRFLCLHGMGTNPEILEAQLDPMRSRLPPTWEFEFLEGEVSTSPFPDIGEAYPGPYLCYYRYPTQEAVQSAVDTVLDVAQSDGPFDAVLGFSNGAALTATALATAASRNPSEPPPFRAAIFFSCITPYRLNSGPVTLTLEGDTIVSATRQDAPLSPPYDLHADPEASGLISELQGRKEIKWSENEPERATYEVLLGYYPPLHATRDDGKSLIDIPTVHVIGEQDRNYGESSRRLVELCNPRLRTVITHAGGHHFPREKSVVGKVARAVEEAMEKAGWAA